MIPSHDQSCLPGISTVVIMYGWDRYFETT